jgi:hypothetical protein
LVNETQSDCVDLGAATAGGAMDPEGDCAREMTEETSASITTFVAIGK